MKRLIVFILLFVVVNSVYSQQRDEWYWDESTKDAVYETPNSKFAKKWYRTPYNEPEECLELLANGTFKFRMSTFRETLLDGNRLYINTTISGTWNRKDKMVLELHFTNVTNVGDPDLLAKLSARKREEVNKKVKNVDTQMKARFVGKTERRSIQRIDNYRLIMNRGEHWKSEQCKKEELEIKRQQKESARKALEAMVTKQTGTLDGHDYVDLGLPSGLLWATCNVGANTASQDGTYFAFGETMPKKDYSQDSFKFYLKQNGKYYLKKYCLSLEYTNSNNFIDGKTTLDLEDDVAHVKWGGDWRMPTRDELEELFEECSYEKFNDGVILHGPNGNTLFLPASGWMIGNKLIEGDCWGCYLTCNATNTAGVWGIDIDDKKMSSKHMYIGYTIRPVNTSKVAETKKKREEQRAIIDQDYIQNLSPEKQKSLENAKKIGYELVDLGLSVRWASMNVGAKRPEDRGLFFSWGEIEPTPWGANHNYKPVVSEDAKILDEKSDPATVYLGTGFHTPSEDQWKELFNKCKLRLSDDEKNTIFIGPNGKSIIIPHDYYWTNKRSWGWKIKGVDPLEWGLGNYYNDYSRPIRPVME